MKDIQKLRLEPRWAWLLSKVLKEREGQAHSQGTRTHGLESSIPFTLELLFLPSHGFPMFQAPGALPTQTLETTYEQRPLETGQQWRMVL